jgi:outer membrane immunogenic protein
MKKILLGAIALIGIGIAAPASAADLYARPSYKAAPPPMMAVIYDWSGFYIGANGGGGWSHKCWDVTNFRGPVAPFSEGCHDATGGVVGGQIGYRWQSAGWVFGLEAQGDWADLKGSNVSLFVPAWTNNSKIDAFGLFTDDKYQGTVTAAGALFDSASETRWGGVVGTGLEFGFAPNWSVAVEYDHLFMGNRDITTTSAGVLAHIPAGSIFRTDSIRQDVDMVTARINYRFNWGGPAVPRY